MTKIDIIANAVVSKRAKKTAKIKSMTDDLARLRAEKGLTYKEIQEVFEKATGEKISENYLYQGSLQKTENKAR